MSIGALSISLVADINPPNPELIAQSAASAVMQRCSLMGDAQCAKEINLKINMKYNLYKSVPFPMFQTYLKLNTLNSLSPDQTLKIAQSELSSAKGHNSSVNVFLDQSVYNGIKFLQENDMRAFETSRLLRVMSRKCDQDELTLYSLITQGKMSYIELSSMWNVDNAEELKYAKQQ